MKTTANATANEMASLLPAMAWFHLSYCLVHLTKTFESIHLQTLAFSTVYGSWKTKRNCPRWCGPDYNINRLE